MHQSIYQSLQEAYVQGVCRLDEAEGSYGQTPKARKAMGDLAIKRMSTPASEYSRRGEKTKRVKATEKHLARMDNPDAGDRSRKSARPYYFSGRIGMTQKDRDWSRGAAEYGHSSYDPGLDGEPIGPGSRPKGRKLARQIKTGVSAKEAYDMAIDYLLDEGYANNEVSAEIMLEHMSDEWLEEILESAANQSDKQIDKGVKTTYKGRNVLDNLHQGRSPGIDRLHPSERKGKVKRMEQRLKARRDDLFKERNAREDKKLSELKKKYGL